MIHGKYYKTRNPTPFLSMMIPIIAFGSTAILGGILTQFRGRCLERASMNIKIDNSFSVELRPAPWAYCAPVLLAALALFVGGAGIREGHGLMFFCSIVFLLLSAGAIFLWYRLRISHVTIFEGKLRYEEGADRVQISFGDVVKVSLEWFTFYVGLASGHTVSIPANFQSSEIIWAFLRAAAFEPVNGPGRPA